ncbi:MAG: secretin N-terminal domain-containing protein, partial [Catenulispora sp.]
MDIDNVLKFFSMAAGKTLIKDPGLTGPVTMMLPQPVSVDEGLRVLKAVLNTKGYTLQDDPMLMRVVPEGGFGGFGGGRFRGGGGGGRRDRGGPQVTVFKLESASAQQVSRIINELFRSNNVGGGGGGRGGRGGFGGGGNFPGGGGGRFPGANPVQDTSSTDPSLAAIVGTQVRASADDYTNSVVVVAPPSMTEQIRGLVSQLDHKVAPNIITRVFHLVNGKADELAPLVSNVLLGAAPTGAAGGALQNVPFEQRVRLTARVGSLNAAAGQVVPDIRTNTLTVSTTAENMATVEKLLQELDA